MNIGDTVRVLKIPDTLPKDNPALLTLFRGCVGKAFPIVAFDGDLIELHVGEAFGKTAPHHQIWLEPDNVQLVEA